MKSHRKMRKGRFQGTTSTRRLLAQKGTTSTRRLFKCLVVFCFLVARSEEGRRMLHHLGQRRHAQTCTGRYEFKTMSVCRQIEVGLPPPPPREDVNTPGSIWNRLEYISSVAILAQDRRGTIAQLASILDATHPWHRHSMA
jgi:hypothetical protein